MDCESSLKSYVERGTSTKQRIRPWKGDHGVKQCLSRRELKGSRLQDLIIADNTWVVVYKQLSILD